MYTCNDKDCDPRDARPFAAKRRGVVTFIRAVALCAALLTLGACAGLVRQPARELGQ
jgi:hypothetical protein